MMSDVDRKILRSAHPLELPAPWYGLLLPLPSLPLEKPLRAELFEKLTELMGLLRGSRELHTSVWLLMDTLHQDGESRKLATHGRRWMPDPGLGVWPDREPPRLWSDEELYEREYGTPLRPLMHTVIHISAGEAASMHAWETMAGTGSVMQLLLEKSPEEFHAEAKAHLLPMIEDETFRGFSMYFPLLSAASVRDRESFELDRWLGSAAVYLRESPEDTALLLLSRIDPSEALRQAGIAWVPPDAAPHDASASVAPESDAR